MRILSANATALLLTALAVLMAAPALAQGVEPTNGIRLGDGRLHPTFDLELRFDSAALSMVDATTATLRSEAVTHFRPGLRFELPSRWVAVQLAGNVEYVWYTGLISPGTQAASHLGAEATLGVAVNKEGAVEFDLDDKLRRGERSNNVAVAIGTLSFFNELAAKVPIHPGGGALEVAPKGAWALEAFEPLVNAGAIPCAVPAECDPTALAGMGYQQFLGGLEGRWLFLPRTAVVVDTSLQTRSYRSTTNPSPLLFNGTLGLAGLLTSKIAIIFKAGWSQDFAPSQSGGAGPGTVIGQAEVQYQLNSLSSVKAGYLRALNQVPVYGIYGDDRGYVEAKATFFGRLNLHANAAADFMTFYNAQTPRDDFNVAIDAGPEYQVTRWMTIGATYNATLRSSTATGPVYNFGRHEGHLRFSFVY